MRCPQRNEWKTEERITAERALIALFPEAELVILEGFKHSRWPKVEVLRTALSRESVCPAETLLAVVTDGESPVKGVPAFGPDEAESLAEHLIAALWGERAKSEPCERDKKGL